MKVVNTRSAEQSDQLSALLREKGAEVIEVPTIRIVDVDFDLGDLSQYKWCVFTSVNTVERVFTQIDSEALQGVLIAAIGEGTANALEANDVFVDLVPEEFVAESLVAAFPNGEGNVLLPRATVARDVLPEGLRANGWNVNVVSVYETVSVPIADDQKNEIRNADAITFTAPSTVASFFESCGVDDLSKTVACIGPVTANALRERGREPEIVAQVHTIPGLVDLIADRL